MYHTVRHGLVSLPFRRLLQSVISYLLGPINSQSQRTSAFIATRRELTFGKVGPAELRIRLGNLKPGRIGALIGIIKELLRFTYSPFFVNGDNGFAECDDVGLQASTHTRVPLPDPAVCTFRSIIQTSSGGSWRTQNLANVLDYDYVVLLSLFNKHWRRREPL
jgi:hypothetical protein